MHTISAIFDRRENPRPNDLISRCQDFAAVTECDEIGPQAEPEHRVLKYTTAPSGQQKPLRDARYPQARSANGARPAAQRIGERFKLKKRLLRRC